MRCALCVWLLSTDALAAVCDSITATDTLAAVCDSVTATDTLAAVCDSITATDRDVFVAVETWHDDLLTPELVLACPPGYCVIEQARPCPVQHDDTTNTNH